MKVSFLTSRLLDALEFANYSADCARLCCRWAVEARKAAMNDHKRHLDSARNYGRWYAQQCRELAAVLELVSGPQMVFNLEGVA